MTTTLRHLKQDQPVTIAPAAAPRNLAWVIRRALIGIALIAAFAVISALLLHSGIDPAAEAAAGIASTD